MQEVIIDLEKIRKFLMGLHLKEESQYERKGILEEAFARCFNHATICLELMSHYWDHWKQAPSCAINFEKLRHQNGERVIEATKGMFIFCISAIEFSIKQALEVNSFPLQCPKKEMYLSEVMGDSSGKFIDANEGKKWKIALRIRNKLVHNNGIWDHENEEMKYSNDLIFTLHKDRMIQGNLRTFTLLMYWIISSYLDWSNLIISRTID